MGQLSVFAKVEFQIRYTQFIIIVAFLKEYLHHILAYDTNAKLYMEKASSYGIGKVVHKA